MSGKNSDVRTENSGGGDQGAGGDGGRGGRGGGRGRGGGQKGPNNRPSKRKADDAGNRVTKRPRHDRDENEGALEVFNNSLIEGARETGLNLIAPEVLPRINPVDLRMGRNGPFVAQDPGSLGFATSFMHRGADIHVQKGHISSVVHEVMSLGSQRATDPDAYYWNILGRSTLLQNENRRHKHQHLLPARGESTRGRRGNRSRGNRSRGINRLSLAERLEESPDLTERPDGPQTPDLAERPDGPPAPQSCGWCTKAGRDDLAKTHRLSSCVWPSHQGDIPGCPRCNTTEHYWDICPRNVALSREALDRDAFNHLIRNRGSLPPIRTTIPWPKLADSLGCETRDGYPATKAYVAQQFQQDQSQFTAYLSNSTAAPPFLRDPSTSTLDVIRQNIDALAASEVFVRHPPRNGGGAKKTAKGQVAKGNETAAGDKKTPDGGAADDGYGFVLRGAMGAVVDNAMEVDNATSNNAANAGETATVDYEGDIDMSSGQTVTASGETAAASGETAAASGETAAASGETAAASHETATAGTNASDKETALDRYREREEEDLIDYSDNEPEV